MTDTNAAAVVDPGTSDVVDTGNANDNVTDKAATAADAGSDKATDKTADTGADKGTDKAAASANADDKDQEKPSALPDNWRDLGLDAAGFTKEQRERAEKLVGRYGSLGGVLKALVEKDDMIRAGKVKRDMPDAKDEKAMAEWRKEQGIPDDPTGYKLPDEVTKRLVDEDKPILASFTEFAHSKNLPPSAVEAATEWYVDLQEKAAAAQAEKDAEASSLVEDKLRDAWSRDEYKGNLNLAVRFLESSPIGKEWAEARLPSGLRLGDMPEFTIWASDKGREQFGDTVFASSESETRHNNRKTEIENIMKTDMKRYWAEGLNKEYEQILEKEARRK
jgi:hypothetical protein